MRILRSGTWTDSDGSARPVDISGLPYDYWYEFAALEGTLEKGQMPTLFFGTDRLLYYVRLEGAGTKKPKPDSIAFPTLDAAIAHAEESIPGPIVWDE
jgi:hypothetical protein